MSPQDDYRSLKVDVETYELLRKIAASEERSLVGVIRRALKAYAGKRAAG